MKLAKKIGKIAVLVGVCPGFVGNRMLFQRQRAGAAMLMLKARCPGTSTRVLYDFGLPMGPFAMRDLAGLDIGWSKEKSKGSTHPRSAVRDGPPRPEDRRGLLRLRREAQRQALARHREDHQGLHRRRPAPTPRKVSDEEILERCIYPMINEGAKILEEGNAIRASDIDMVWINGYGWPVYRGGPMFYGDTVGLKTWSRS